MSPDPLGGSIQNPQSLNRYAYVLNNPESFIDPTGSLCQLRNGSVQNISNSQCKSDHGTVLAVFTTAWVTTTTKGAISEDCGGGLCPLPEEYLFFLSEATGPNAGGLWWTPPPPPDAFLASLAQKLRKRVEAAQMTAEDRQVQALADAVVQKAGYLDTPQFWAEWTGASVLAGALPNYGALQVAYDEFSMAIGADAEGAVPGSTVALSDFVSGLSGNATSTWWGVAGNAVNDALSLF